MYSHSNQEQNKDDPPPFHLLFNILKDLVSVPDQENKYTVLKGENRIISAHQMKLQHKQQPLKKQNGRKDSIYSNKKEIYRTDGKKTLKLLRGKL